MKNIIIIGPPRIGKTALAKLIVKQIPCFSAINTDVIRESIYKSLFIGVEKEERLKIVRESFPTFVKEMLKQYTCYYNPELFYVIEGDLLSLESAIDIKKEFDIDIVCVGAPTITEPHLFKRIIDNGKKYGCWTEKYTDIELHKLCEEIIEQSKKEYKLANKKGLIYLDNSYDNACLQKYVDHIK
jgi:adenylate kinase family enzyme